MRKWMRIRGFGHFSRATWSRMVPGQELEDEQEKCLGMRLVRGEVDQTSAVLRGGSWFSDLVAARAGRRCRARLDYSHYALGFRLVREGARKG